ncbi:hypothetical protein [Methylocystis bryophila]|uniref:Uncharacterized protein n=1 Tax=Methylocystis bryophila TaxID=655015 RepID=A0A1W6MSS9_9HYPH|nr:hypothetical protein [Methylocystis bryophila]ARN80683.1 hypothetical protein B1812_05900 [Methylocystis bryophila]BDV40749.1 hypothetical protein DSM21852_40020 [Methylocystis bryophila]
MTKTPYLNPDDRQDLSQFVNDLVDAALAPPPPPRRRVPQRRPQPEDVRPALVAMFRAAGCDPWSDALASEQIEALKLRAGREQIQARRQVAAAPAMPGGHFDAAPGPSGIQRIGSAR